MAHPPDSRDNPPTEPQRKFLKERLGKPFFAVFMDGSNDGLNLVDLTEFAESIKNPKDPNRNRGES